MDLARLTESELAALRAQLGLTTEVTGRSPIKPRQLNDLRLLPTKDDPRPTFFMSAETPRTGEDFSKTSQYPRLLWHTNGEEITVTDAREHTARVAEGYLTVAPANAVAPDPMEAMRAALEALSPEDRALMIDAQNQDRMTALRSKLSALAPEDLEALLAGVDSPPAKRKRSA